jgi:hypothetical protein
MSLYYAITIFPTFISNSENLLVKGTSERPRYRIILMDHREAE